jgi:large subunit ribosomal protein L21
MYAIVETGAKQYKVSKNDIIEVERFDIKKGKEVKLDNVLFISDKKDATIGAPFIKGAHVVCDLLGERRAKKVISFKYRRRHASSKKKIGHRQGYAVLRVKEIKVE